MGGADDELARAAGEPLHEPSRQPGPSVDLHDILASQRQLNAQSRALTAQVARLSADLSVAYDAILEGWVRALDLRDNETQGHSRRVTELTGRLAETLGVCASELVHIRRGALLHDIGKLGVPDAILHKAGPLTSAEWAVMHRHPRYAYDMLAPIPFLAPALAIPLYHHERWDGAGYPLGLSGAAIPYQARIFAVVDVWDALTSDRPYRRALTAAQATHYLREQVGRHFEPAIVGAFLELILAP